MLNLSPLFVIEAQHLLSLAWRHPVNQCLMFIHIFISWPYYLLFCILWMTNMTTLLPGLMVSV